MWWWEFNGLTDAASSSKGVASRVYARSSIWVECWLYSGKSGRPSTLEVTLCWIQDSALLLRSACIGFAHNSLWQSDASSTIKIAALFTRFLQSGVDDDFSVGIGLYSSQKAKLGKLEWARWFWSQYFFVLRGIKMRTRLLSALPYA